ncbi:MAG TPA: tRNA dihydrouridine synthase DusB [Rhizomicrobium sp.]|nr:tRNA dihydrouridine synthase DusB [Rhizomicrobium sp.]
MSRTFQIGGVTIAGRVLTAPMSGVSDLPFRRTASRLGAPYVATEMVACDMLAAGRPDVMRRAAVGEGLPLMVVQLVGREAEWIAKGAAMAEAAGADIIDLNMGCPAKCVTGGLSGSALMRDLDLAIRLIDAAVGATTRPVTLKMRLGWDDETRNAPALAERAEKSGVKAITVHGRTRQQFYKGASNWRAVAEVKAATRLPVIVNGDVVDAASAREALKQSGADAVMVGRGACGRPWIASAIEQALQTGEAMREPGLAERLEIALEHFRDTLRFYGDAFGLKIFRKHLGWYVETGARSACEQARRAARSHLCRLDQPAQVEAALIALWEETLDDEGRIDRMGAGQWLANDRRLPESYQAVSA